MKAKHFINLFITVAAGTLAATPAHATFHFMQIEQVIAGVNGDTTAQAIQLRMRSSFQNLMAQSRIRCWDAQGLNPIVLIDMVSNVTGSMAGDRVLIVSPNFSNLTSPPVNSDFTMTNLIPVDRLAAGSITFEDDFGTIFWRLSWGGASYTGDNGGDGTNDDSFPGDFGPPWPGSLPSVDLRALLFQGAAGDLSTTNADDYAISVGAAVFTNNAGATFTVTEPPQQGACCDDLSGVCEESIEQSVCLAGGGRFGGADSLCADLDPPCLAPPMGACCVELRGECLESVSPAACAAEGGRFGGDGSTCSTIDPRCAPVLTIGLERVIRAPAGDAKGAETLNSPLRVTHAADGSGRLFIVDQTGQIRIVKDGVLFGMPFLDIAAKMVGLSPGFDERGLLGMAFHPDYATNGRFFVRYSAPGGTGDHRAIVAEYAVLGDPATSDLADINSESIILDVDEPEFNHNGGQIAFGPDGLLYFSLGDGGGANDGLSNPALPHGPIGNGQDIDTLLGSVLRIDVDAPPDPGLAYHIPIDNPFVGTAGADEIFAYGFRNPYSFSFDDGPGGDNKLYLGDVGQALFEEIDIVESGGNYGWVIREGAHCFDPSASTTPPVSCPSVGTVLGDPLIDPVMEYLQPIPCSSDTVCAPLGVACGSDGRCLNHGGISIMAGHVYRGSKLTSLVGKFVLGDFDSGSDVQLYYFDTTGVNQFARREFRVTPRDALDGLFIKGMGEDEDGEIYVCATGSAGPFGGLGVIFRISTPIPTAIGGGSRYLSITLPDGPDPVRIVVTPNCPAGIAKYVGTPGDPDNTAVLVDSSQSAAFLTKEAWGNTVHVTDIDIIPSSSYKVQVDVGSPETPALSGAATATTAKWGDAAGLFVDGIWEPPNGGNEISDVLAILQAFVNAPTAPPMFQIDMRGAIDLCRPNRQIDIADALGAIAGFQGLAYPQTFPQCPIVCP